MSSARYYAFVERDQVSGLGFHVQEWVGWACDGHRSFVVDTLDKGLVVAESKCESGKTYRVQGRSREMVGVRIRVSNILFHNKRS